MHHIRPALITSIALTAAAAGLWGCVAAFLGGAPDRDSNALLGMAITVSAVVVACWAYGCARRASDKRRQADDRRWQALADAVEQDRSMLIRTLGAVSARKAGPPTAPIRVR